MPPRLVISGLGLANPHVGQGVYAWRIIEGLLRRHPDLPFKVVAPAHFEALRGALPSSHWEPVEGRPPHRHELVAQPWWAGRLVAHVAGRFPGAMFHSPGPMMTWRRAPRSVVTLHDCIYRSFPRYLGRFLLRRWLLRLSEWHATRGKTVLTDSEFSARDLSTRAGIPREKLRVLYPWVDERSFAPVTPAALAEVQARLGLPARYWLYVGGYDYRKNVEALVAAYAAVRQKQPPPLVLAGRIPPAGAPEVYCDVVGALTQAALSAGAVIQPGLVDAADLPLVMRGAALLVYPSRMEGFGLPPAEAMAVGTPVLCADNSSLREVIRDPACRFSAERPEELAAMLASVADGGEKAFCRPLPEEFTEAQGIERYLKLLGLTA